MTEKEELAQAKKEAKEAKAEVKAIKDKAEKEKKEALAKAEALKKAEAGKIYIKASFPAKDKDNGNTIVCLYEGKGNSVEEAITDLKDEEKHAYPVGLVALVVVEVKKGDRVVKVSLAPHRARQILEQKNLVVFEKKFGKF